MSSLLLLKTKDNGGCKLDCLPYDVLVSILSSPLLDIHTIMLFAELWPHYDSLATHVLRYYHLPRLYLQSTLDQEGKRQYRTWFHFHSLDVDNRRVTFMVQPSSVTTATSKRYISNTSTAARPHLRHITLHHQYQHQPPFTHSPITVSPSSSSVDLFNNNGYSVTSSSCSLSIQQCPKNIIDTITNKPTESSSSSQGLHTTGTNMIQPHSLSLKHGFHTLFARTSRKCQQKLKQTQRSSAITTTNTVNKEKWQFSYRVSYTNDSQQQDLILYDKNDHHGNYQQNSITKKNKDLVKTEHMYLSPICLTVSLATLRAASAPSSIFGSASSLTKSPPSYSWFEKYVKSKLSFL